MRQSAEGVDVLPDILGDGGGGGDGSSGNNSDADDGGPAGKKGILWLTSTSVCILVSVA